MKRRQAIWIAVIMGITSPILTFSQSMREVIVFSSNGDIWRVNPDGNDLQQVTFDGGGKGGPSISPDGTKIAFGKQHGGLWVMNADGSNPTLLCSNGNYSKTSWSPDGSKILYMNVNVCNEDIWMANSDGSSCIPFIDGSVGGISGPVTQFAAWSSSNVILFNSHFCGSTCEQRLLYKINPDKTGLQQIVAGDYGSWSPDGNKIAFQRCVDIYVANADGSNETRLTTGGSSIYPHWSPDGTKIAFFRNNNIWTMNADGSNQQQITNGSFNDAMLHWGNITTQDTQPPKIAVSVGPNILWPPNHKLVDIHATVTASDACDPNPSIILTSATSDEPDNGLGDGDKPNDVQDANFGSADYDFRLRAERSGNGDGRVYTVTYTATDAAGNSASAQAKVTVPHDLGKVVGTNQVTASPESFSLAANYPNPFNAETVICYELPKSSYVTLCILNPLGQEIRRLVDAEQAAGYYVARWDGKDISGSDVASGMYLYRLQAGDFVAMRKMLLTR